MSNKNIVYFSKMFQSVPAMAPIQQLAGGKFVVGRRSTLNAAKSMFSDVEWVRYQKWFGPFNQGKQALTDAEIILTGSPYRRFLEPYRAKKYMVFHGTYMMISKDTTDKLAHFDRLFLTGPRMKQMLARAQLDVECVDTGFIPFSEFPEQDELQRQALLRHLSLDPNKKTIVYTPSRGKIGSWLACALDMAKALTGKFNLIMRPHPSQALNAVKADKKSYQQVKQVIAASDNAVLDLITCSLPEVLSVADLVISDANSPAEESLFYDAPQLFIETDRFSREHLKNMGLEQKMHNDDLQRLLTLYDCGPSFNGCGDWVGQVESAMAVKNDYVSARNDYFQWVFGARDRRAAERISAYLK